MSIALFILILGLLGAGYFFYGNYLSGIAGLDHKRNLPSVTRYDGIDYVPAKNWLILFGHHFSSIAGAGPIVGPVLAYMSWGWAGTLVWIILGSVFMGAVHDFLALVVSIREDGQTIGRVAERYISPRAGKVLLVFLWLALVLVIAVFASLCAKAFVSQPQVVSPSLGLIPVAVFFGFLIYKLKVNFGLSTFIGLGLMAGIIIAGNIFPISLGGGHAYLFWIIILFVYAFFASTLPVNILLQPRDYITSFLLFFGVIVAVAGLITRPLPVHGALFFRYNSSLGPFFPVMFVTVACGAISGFHSLVSSGTSSKQIVSETQAKPIGIGSMILEAAVAVIALFCVAFGVKQVSPGQSPLEVFSQGFSKVSYFLGGHGKELALIILNAFILTTLDTATRIARLLTQELLHLKNKWAATGIVVFAGAYLGISGQWQAIWPVFGASNQLVAAVALIVISAWLINKKINAWVALVPAAVMMVITVTALVINVIRFYRSGNYLLCVISTGLIIMSGLVLSEVKGIKKARKNERS